MNQIHSLLDDNDNSPIAVNYDSSSTHENISNANTDSASDSDDDENFLATQKFNHLLHYQLKDAKK